MARSGVSIDVPDGWDGRILFTDAAGAGRLLLQVANFELPANEGFEPPQELPPGEKDPIKGMGAGDVLVIVSTGEPDGEAGPAPG